MGGTHIALIVVGAVLVALAVAVGVSQFSEDPVQANQDAVDRYCYRIAAQAQVWYKQPKEAGGGGHSFEGMTLEVLGLVSSNEDGTFELQNVTEKSFQAVGTGVEDRDGDGEPLKVRLTYDAFTDQTAYELMET